MSASDVRRIGLDCEFIPNNLTHSGLLTLSLVDDMGYKLYLVNTEADNETAYSLPFLREAVIPHIDAGTGDPVYAGLVGMRERVQAFFELVPRYQSKVYAWCGAQDMVRLHGLWVHDWNFMPRSIPHSFTDIEELLFRYGISEDELPEQHESTKHHALWDAYHDLEIVRYIESRRAL
jgi:hypothetical protein